ncbi:MAG: translocation/assembly module TamB domain-containing protein [bacterium]
MARLPEQLRKIGKIAGRVGLVLGCVLLVVAILLLLEPVRNRLLDRALAAARSSLPGELAVERSRWPSPGDVRLAGLCWTDGPDTLLTVEEAILSLQLAPLFRRDLAIRELRLDGCRIDLPALRARFPSAPADAAPADEAPAPATADRPTFPRPGSLPPAPSLQVERLVFSAPRIVVDDSLQIADVRLVGNIDLRHGRDPLLQLEEASLRGPEATWRLDRLALHCDLATGRLQGEGAGQPHPGWPLRLDLAPAGRDSFVLTIQTGGEQTTPEPPGLQLAGHLKRDGLTVHGLDLTARLTTPGTRDLATIPALAEPLAELAPQPGLTVNAAGSVAWSPSPAVDLACTIVPNRWCEGGQARIHLGDEQLSVDGLAIRLPGLELTADGQRGPDSLRVRCDLQLRDLRWLAIWLPEAELPDSVAARLHLVASGAPTSPRLEGRLTAAGRHGDILLDELTIDAATPALGFDAIRIDWLARAQGYAVTSRLNLDHSADELSLFSAPIRLHAETEIRGDLPAFDDLPLAVRYRPTTGKLAVTALRVTGVGGDLWLDGILDAGMNGRFTLAGRWPAPPLLLTRALDLTPAKLDSLTRDWNRDGPFTLGLQADLTGGGEPANPQRLSLTGSWLLPGPRTIACLLPAGARVDDLGPLAGDCLVTVDDLDSRPRVTATIDLGRTGWLDQARADGFQRGDTVGIDSCRIALPGCELFVTGGRNSTAWDLRGDLELTSAEFLQYFLAEPREALELGLSLQTTVTGDPQAPRVNVSLTGHAADAGWRLPELKGSVAWQPDGLAADLTAPAGAIIGDLALETVTAAYRTETAGQQPWPGILRLHAAGPDLQLRLATRLDRPDDLELVTDTLALELAGYGLANTAPFRVDLDGETGDCRISGLDLAGEMGHLRLDGTIGQDSNDLRADLDLVLPDEPILPTIPVELWPKRLVGTARLEGRERLDCRVTASGLRLAADREAAATLELESDPATGLAATIEVTDPDGNLLTGEVRLPAGLAALPAGGLAVGPLSGRLELDRLPVPLLLERSWSSAENRQHILFSGRCSLEGTTDAPGMWLQLQARFPGWPKLERYSISLLGRLIPMTGPGEMAPPDWFGTTAATGASPVLAPAGPGLAATLTLEREGLPVLTGSGTYPLTAALVTPMPALDPEAPLAFTLRSDRLLLEDFDPLLPANAGLEGSCQIDLQATGAVRNPSLAGAVTVPRLVVSLADGTRVAMHGRLDLSGSGRSPVLRGAFEVENGVIQIPEPPKQLHPIRGEALLWATVDSLAFDVRTDSIPPAPDSTPVSASAPKPTPATVDTEAAPVTPDFDVALSIPSGFWLRGQGLEVELAGDLRLVQQGTLPSITGDLAAVRGFFRFLGRTLFIEQGRVIFYGEDEIDPELDLSLQTRIEGYQVWVKFGGTAREPKLTLLSNPELPEGDIMSILLFGRPLTELSSDQLGLVQQRATEVVALFGTARLEAQLSQQLGVDMVTIQQRQDEGEGSSLVIGKYLSRRALLKYEQALAELSTYFINLEYYLNRHFKVETTISRQSQSGLELNWSHEY